MLTLYFAPGTCALALHIALEQAGADYRAVKVDFSSNQQKSPDYLVVNPKGRVPALVTDQGILTETPAILAMQKKVPQTVGDSFDLIEREMFKGPWVMGAVYTVADAYLFTLALWLEGDGVDPARFPKIADHRRRMAEHPLVSKVVAAERAAWRFGTERSATLVGALQAKLDSRTAGEFRLNVHGAAVQVENSLHNFEAEPRADAKLFACS